MAVADTLIGIFLEAVATLRRPDQFMRRTEAGWESIASERALADVEALALALRELGVGRGDRVVLLSETRYEWAVTDLAILGLGAVTVPIYPTLTAAQCRALLENCEPQVLVVSTIIQLEKIRAASAGLPFVRAVVCMEPLPPGGPASERALDALMARGTALRQAEPGAFRASAQAVRPDDLATIIYTSGTTGEPKGAMLTHGNIASNIAASLQVMHFVSSDRCLSFLPLSHIFERMGGFYSMLASGVSIAYARNMESVAADALEVRPTLVMGVPRFYEKVVARVTEAGHARPAPVRALFFWGLARGRAIARAHYARRLPSALARVLASLAGVLVLSKIRARLGGRLRFGFSGSAPLSPDVMEFFYAIGVPIIEGYGLTETSPVICLNPSGREKPGTVGPPIPGVEVRIGDEGEIVTRGPHVMRGYFRNEAATHEAIRDGWFHTGDIGSLDADGYLVITDRLKDLLVLAGGKKVAPQPLEAKLELSPWVGEAVLLGDRRPYMVCLVVPDFVHLEAEARARGWPFTSRRELIERPDVRALYQAEIDLLNADRAPFERIKRFALLDRELSQERGELTPTLKLKRRVITVNFAALIDSLYAGHVTAEGAATSAR
jgi:long-chain acyl-CoA synthetase